MECAKGISHSSSQRLQRSHARACDSEPLFDKIGIECHIASSPIVSQDAQDYRDKDQEHVASSRYPSIAYPILLLSMVRSGGQTAPEHHPAG